MSNWQARELAERRSEWLDSMAWSVCQVCSAIVWDSDEHDEWHAQTRKAAPASPAGEGGEAGAQNC